MLARRARTWERSNESPENLDHRDAVRDARIGGLWRRFPPGRSAGIQLLLRRLHGHWPHRIGPAVEEWPGHASRRGQWAGEVSDAIAEWRCIRRHRVVAAWCARADMP